MYYRLKAGVLALCEQDEHSRKVFVRLAEGAVVQLASAVRESGLVDVQKDGVRFTVFYCDLIASSFPGAPDLDSGTIDSVQ